MKQQVYNPYLPLTEYVPDGEPHVFGDRVYVYGSHDEARSTRFCVRDYTVWSAPTDDLSDWKCHGVTYKKSQDPRSKQGREVDFYAPDCVRGNDGKYYLYYVAMGPNTKNFGPMSVAVSDDPGGSFEYLGDIRYPDGTPVLQYLTNDPTVLNDDGHIWLYYGWGLGRDFRSKVMTPLYHYVLSKISGRSIDEIKRTKPSILSCAVAELEEDMMTVKGEPKAVLDSKTTAPKGTLFYEHPFYEAPSIRKFGQLYYLVYSSGTDNALAYATSHYPDRDFQFRGVIISNSDLGFQGNRRPKTAASTIHGGIEVIGGQAYVFYHRSTNNTDFSRQTCAEPIEILPDGTIRQVEVTSCGLNGGPLRGEGSYPAAISCNLTYGKRIPIGLRKGQKYPRIDEENGEVFVHDLENGAQVGYKYFRFDKPAQVRVEYKGDAVGVLELRVSENGECLGTIPISSSATWRQGGSVAIGCGTYPVFLRFVGKGKLSLKEISFEIR